MSYEIADARVADMRAKVWTLTHVTFTGAAILRRDKAAYRETWIELEYVLSGDALRLNRIRSAQHGSGRPHLR